MSLSLSVCAASAVLLAAMCAFGGAAIEDVHPLKWKKGDHGYRGSMGDIIEL